MWTFFEFVEADGPVIKNWFDSLPPGERGKAKAEFDAMLDITLRPLPAHQWPTRYSKKMTGRGWHPIHEFRFNVRRIRYRVLYVFGPRAMQVTMLSGHQKAEGKLPASAANTAHARRERIDDRYLRPYFS